MWINSWTWVEARRRPIEAGRTAMTAYLGELPVGDVDAPGYQLDGGQAFLVQMGGEQAPLQAHFHAVDQFQYVVGGSGRLGRHQLQPPQVHYADAHTPYGPIAAGSEGLAYLTLRAVSDTGAHRMPASRQRLAEGLARSPRPPSARRSLTVDLAATAGHDHQLTDHVPSGDGLRIATLEVAAAGPLALPVVAGAGAYLVVVAGSVVDRDGRDHPAGSVGWSPPAASRPGVAPSLRGGPAGARLAFLQLPSPPSRAQAGDAGDLHPT